MEEQRFVSYLESLPSPITDELEELYERAIEDDVPVIRRDAIGYLYTLCSIVKPHLILELGAGVGFSALCMRHFTADAKITTVENYAPRISECKANFKRLDPDARITLIEQDALEVVRGLDGKYDLIFLDSAKGQYVNMVPDLIRLMSQDAVLIADNVFSDGDLLESNFLIKRRNRTIHKRMREFVSVLYHDESLATSILPIGDGLMVATKKIH